jgi:hypothetical protein
MRIFLFTRNTQNTPFKYEVFLFITTNTIYYLKNSNTRSLFSIQNRAMAFKVLGVKFNFMWHITNAIYIDTFLMQP